MHHVEFLFDRGTYETPCLLATPLDGIPISREEAERLRFELDCALKSTDPTYTEENIHV